MHSSQLQTALATAESLCQQHGQRLTQLRRRVLEIILSSDRPLGAYAILEQLCAEQKRRAAPPTVYRALDFLLECGLVHRLASLNVYAACSHPGHHHSGQFLICQQCGRVRELDSQLLSECLAQEASSRGFQVVAQMVEVLGCCADCQPIELTKV